MSLAVPVSREGMPRFTRTTRTCRRRDGPRRHRLAMSTQKAVPAQPVRPSSPERPVVLPPAKRRAGGEAPRTTSPSGWTTLRTVASDGVWIRHRTSVDPPPS